MNENDNNLNPEALRECILSGTERMLRRKAALGESVVYANADGSPLVLSASDALELFLKERQIGR